MPNFNSVTLLFTDLNWHTQQTVTVSAAEDDDTLDGRGNFSHSRSELRTRTTPT